MARDEGAPGRPVPPADERAAHAFADGYGEGLRDALRDVLQHVSRGHLPQELRWLIESRLARVPEEVELKRRALLGPPRRVAWDALLRAPSPVSAPEPPAPTLDQVLEGTGVLFREDRPTLAIQYLAGRWKSLGRVLAVARPPGAELPVPPERLTLLPIGSDQELRDPGEAAGRIHAILSEGAAVVYLDCVEFLVREFGADITLRFVEWLMGEVRSASGLLVVSVDPSTLEAIAFRRLQRLFPTVR